MRYILLLQEAFDIAKTSQFVLLYLCVSLLDAAIPQDQSEENLALTCAFLVIRWTLIVLSTILIAGFTYSIWDKVLNQNDISVNDGFRRAESHIIRIGALYLLILIPWIFIIAAMWIAFNRLLTPLATTFIWLILSPLLSFGICAIIIDEQRVFKSATFSLFVIRKNFIQSITYGGFFIFLQYTSLALLVWLVTSPFDPQNSLQLGFDYATFQIPFVSKANQIISIVLSPLQTAVFTLIYLNFNNRTATMEKMAPEWSENHDLSHP